MISNELRHDLEQDCSVEEIARISQSLEEFKRTWISYPKENVYKKCRQMIFSKAKANV